MSSSPAIPGTPLFGASSPSEVIESSTPILVVDAIEPCLPFWVDRLGFETATEVPHGDRLGFAILTRGDVVVMLQTRDSLADDLPDLADAEDGEATILYVRVDDLDAIERAVDSVEIVVPRRTTFYGADELGVREPGGHVVLFARFAEGAPS